MGLISYWLSIPRRWWHRHGFNVQSPWAYEFVRDAVSDKSWFYAFDKLSGKNSDRQLFRIVYWLKAADVEAYTDNNITKAHLVAPLSRNRRRSDGFIVCYYDKNHLQILEEDIRSDRFSASSCIIVEDIRHTASSLWRTINYNHPTTSTFDLGNRGVAFFDPARQKQCYLL
jgi:hypothetical protein